MAGRPPTSSSRDVRAVTRAILFTDIVGSTRYFASHGDKAGLAMIQRHNRALFPIVERADGRVIKTIGDSIFAVFEDPAAALVAAFAMQRRMEEERADVASEEATHIRVGVHYGLVREVDRDFFGDAVNLAERVKSSAAADKIFVSRMLRDMVRGDPRFGLVSAGPRELKGAAEPMELFELVDAPAPGGHALWQAAWRRARRLLRSRRALAALAAGALLVAAGGGLWWRARTAVAPARTIAVLPFRNLANDTGLDYLSLALTDELNTQLRSAGTVLIRPTSTVMRYKGRNWDPVQVARELKVGTLIEGSYLQSRDQMQVNVAIIDARANEQAWSGKTEGFLDDLLGLLDRVSRKVITELRLHLAESEPSRLYGTNDPAAYGQYLRGLGLQQEITEKNNGDAIRFLEEAVTLDPNFARAQAALAGAYATRFWWNFSNDTGWLDKAEGRAREALRLDTGLAAAHYALAYALEGKGQRAAAIRANLASYRLDPQYVHALTNIARTSFYMRSFDRALLALDRIAEIDPTQNIHMRKAIYLFFAKRPEASRAENRLAETRASGVDEMTFIAFTYVWLGDLESAERMLEKLEEAEPGALSIHEVKAWLETARGRHAAARREMAFFSTRESWGIAQEMAALLAIQGAKQEAIEWLEKAVAMGAPSYAWFTSEHYRSLRGEPRYEAVLHRLEAEFGPVREEMDQLIL